MTVPQRVRELARAAVITAETTFRPDQYRAYERARASETGGGARWALETMLENARIAERKGYPLCDDTGIPHLFLEVGVGVTLGGDVLAALQEGVADGQRALPTRPMGVVGNVAERLSQSGGLSDDPAAVAPPAMIVKVVPGAELRVTLMMLGGGPGYPRQDLPGLPRAQRREGDPGSRDLGRRGGRPPRLHADHSQHRDRPDPLRGDHPHARGDQGRGPRPPE